MKVKKVFIASSLLLVSFLSLGIILGKIKSDVILASIPTVNYTTPINTTGDSTITAPTSTDSTTTDNLTSLDNTPANTVSTTAETIAPISPSAETVNDSTLTNVSETVPTETTATTEDATSSTDSSTENTDATKDTNITSTTDSASTISNLEPANTITSTDTPVTSVTDTAATTTSLPSSAISSTATQTPTIEKTTAETSVSPTTSTVALASPTTVNNSPALVSTVSASSNPQISASQLDLSNQINGPITENKKLCVTLNRGVDNVIFRLNGPTQKDLTTFEPTPTTYCSRLIINDLESGSYKLIVMVTADGKDISNSVDIVIKKNITESLIKTAAELLASECSKAGAENLDKCKELLIAKYADKIKCQNLSDEECKASLKNTYTEAVVAAEKKYERIKERASEIFGKEMSIEELENIINEGEENLGVSVPIKTKQTAVKILKSYSNIIIDKDKGLIQTAPIAVIIDTDGDGIPDETEIRIGTSPNKKDTDGDGYSDSEEILNGYNPLGGGKNEIALSPIERAILESQTIEHPKTSGEEQNTLTIEKIENNAKNSSNGYNISGKAEPNKTITLYIYSDIPVITTVTTDEFGNWEYHFKEPLEDGTHEVYIAINDNTGKVVSKSKPFDLFIKEAKAVTAQDMANINKESTSDSLIKYYILSAIGLTILGVIIFFSFFRQKNNISQ